MDDLDDDGDPDFVASGIGLLPVGLEELGFWTARSWPAVRLREPSAHPMEAALFDARWGDQPAQTKYGSYGLAQRVVGFVLCVGFSLGKRAREISVAFGSGLGRAGFGARLGCFGGAPTYFCSPESRILPGRGWGKRFSLTFFNRWMALRSHCTRYFLRGEQEVPIDRNDATGSASLPAPGIPRTNLRTPSGRRAASILRKCSGPTRIRLQPPSNPPRTEETPSVSCRKSDSPVGRLEASGESRIRAICTIGANAFGEERGALIQTRGLCTLVVCKREAHNRHVGLHLMSCCN